MTFTHDFPDAIWHLYQAGGVDEDLWLYAGAFSVDDDGRHVGDVRWRWGRRPRIEARGDRATKSSDYEQLLAAGGGMWMAASTLRIAMPEGTLPSQPTAVAPVPAEPVSDVMMRPVGSTSVTQRVEQELGTSVGLERVTFLVPNGWDGHDATGICNPTDFTQLWHGRTDAVGGWRVTFDRLASMDAAAWRELRDMGGHRFTHTAQLERAEGGTFTGPQAFAALDRVRLGMNLALGRRTTCALPVGWRDDRAVWCRWRTAPVDQHHSSSHWLDDTIACQQVRDVVSLMLDFTADDANLAAVRPALAYYVAGNVDVDVELAVAIPLSALQLLAYYRFIEQRAAYSQTQWKKKGTEGQVRHLLAELQVELAVPPHFEHLVAVRDRLAEVANTAQPGKSPPQPLDGLGVVVKMRNVVTHPTRHRPKTFDHYEWAEAAMHVRYWLCLALLNTIGYNGQVSPRLEKQPPWTGEVRTVPWAP